MMATDPLRSEIVRTCRALAGHGLMPGTSGNVSARQGDAMLITPSAIGYDVLAPEQVVEMALDAAPDAASRPRPSSEWRFHRDILRDRTDAGAVVHTHAPHATALAMTRQPIPAAHYMVAAFGGADVRCADYALFGTQALSDAALHALDDRKACLLANHGAITLGRTLADAAALAVELEILARQYLMSLQAGGPVLLSAAEIDAALTAFQDYGASATRA